MLIRKKRLVALCLLLPLHAFPAQLAKADTEYFVMSLMIECFSAYRQAMGDNISNVQIINLCECASRKTTAKITYSDLEPQNKTKTREKVISLMRNHGTICGYDVLVPDGLK